MLPHDETGSGPALVLLHAGVADRTMWTEHLEPLADAGFRVVALDLPGFGEAAVAPGEQAPWNDVLAAMRELDIERAALVGNSFGGAVALRVATVAPVAVSALALVSAPAPGVEPSPELKAAWEAEESAVESGDLAAAIETVVETWTLPGAPPELRERIAAAQRRIYALDAEVEDFVPAPDPLDAAPDALTRVDVPALVAVGEHDKPDFHRGADELARVLPHARREVIPAAGHLAPLETPEAFRALLLGFLSETRE